MAHIETKDEAEIVSRLAAELPGWRYEGGQIRRTYRTHGWKATLMAVNTVGHLAEVAWHHPDILASFNRVDVSLISHDAGGITERDFALARKIDEVLLWRPELEGGALSGAPDDDPAAAYIKHGK
jgi:4a-hydroxytetrahydrobiopterin dehydratase